MRFVNDENGLSRIRNNQKYKPKPISYYCDRKPKIKVESEDTKIRKDIYKNIIELMANNKSNIEIEIYLRNMYPDYAEYIAKVVNDQFVKRNLNKKTKIVDTEIGDER